MKYAFIQCWFLTAGIHKLFMKLVTTAMLNPMRRFNILSKTQKEQIICACDNIFLSFPQGWVTTEAFLIVSGLCLFPLIIITVKLQIDIYSNPLDFGAIAATIIALCYRHIFHKHYEFVLQRIENVHNI